MKKMQKFFSCFLALVMCASLTTSSFATYNSGNFESSWTRSGYESAVILDSSYVDSTPNVMPARISPRDAADWLFTMDLQNVYEHVYSNKEKGKYFRGSDLKNNYVRAEGVIDNASAEYVTVGLGYFDDIQTFLDWSFHDVECNKFFSVSWPKSYFDPDVYYLGYVQCPYGSAQKPYTGYVDYFDSSWA